MKTLLVTGASGFVGQTIASLVAGTNEHGLRLKTLPRNTDLRDYEQLYRAVAESECELVIHLAGQSFVPESFRHPRATYDVNFLGTLNLLEALKASGFAGRMLYVGSGDVYGRVEHLPIVEEYPLRPRSPYAVSKVAAEALCYQWSQTESFDIVMARPFNHIGPGQSDRFVLSDFAKQIVEMKLGRRRPELRTGNIDVTRDFTDVRDVVEAYFLLVTKGRRGEAYNVCSGRELSIRELIAMFHSIAGIVITIEQDRDRMRAAEQKRVVGSYEKLHRDTGWQPRIGIEESLRDILDYWEATLVKS